MVMFHVKSGKVTFNAIQAFAPTNGTLKSSNLGNYFQERRTRFRDYYSPAY